MIATPRVLPTRVLPAGHYRALSRVRGGPPPIQWPTQPTLTLTNPPTLNATNVVCFATSSTNCKLRIEIRWQIATVPQTYINGTYTNPTGSISETLTPPNGVVPGDSHTWRVRALYGENYLTEKVSGTKQFAWSPTIPSEPATISNEQLVALSPTSARLSWNTNQACDSQAEYDDNIGLTSSALEPPGGPADTNPTVAVHQIDITGLSPAGGTFYARALSINSNAQTTTGATLSVNLPDLDAVAPTITSGPTETGLTTTGVTVMYGTDEPSPGAEMYLEWGLVQGGPYPNTKPYDGIFSTTPSRNIINVPPSAGGTLVYYRVRLRDSSSNEMPAFSAEESFTTQPSGGTGSGLLLHPAMFMIGVEFLFSASNQPANWYDGIRVFWRHTTVGAVWKESKPLFPQEHYNVEPDPLDPTKNIVVIYPPESAHGGICNLTPGVTYEVKVEHRDAAGTITTKTDYTTTYDDPGDPALPAITHYVNFSTGDDARNAATAANSATPWQTLDRLITHMNTATVPVHGRLAGGDFAYPVGTVEVENPNGVALTISAEVADRPTDDGLTENANTGSRVVISGGYVAANIAAWTPVTHTGPGIAGVAPGGQYVLYERDFGSIAAAPWQMGYSDTKWGPTTRSIIWNPIGPSLTDGNPAKAAEVIQTNKTQPFGHWIPDPSATRVLPEFLGNRQKCYIHMPNGINPNTKYWWYGKSEDSGIQIASPNVRLSGIEFRNCAVGIEVAPGGDDLMIDHCLSVGNYYDVNGIVPNGTFNYPKRPIIQKSIMIDRGIWVEGRMGLGWKHPKGSFWLADGTRYPVTRVGNKNETSAIFMGQGGFTELLIRECLIKGKFNGVNKSGANHDKYSSRNTHVLECEIAEIYDDGMEPEGRGFNWLSQKNFYHDVAVVTSDATADFGPMVHLQDVMYNITSEHHRINHETLTGGGPPVQGNDVGVTAAVMKFGGERVPAQAQFINCTIWTDYQGPSANGQNPNAWGTQGFGAAAGGGRRLRFWVYNCIFRMSSWIFSISGNDDNAYRMHLDEDYNAWFTNSAALDHGRANAAINFDTLETLIFATYRTRIASHQATNPNGKGVHSNEFPYSGANDTNLKNPTDFAWLDAQLVDPLAGTKAGLQIVGGSPLLLAGSKEAADWFNLTYAGATPNLGHEP